jgi:ParB family transcriptional regulator, chromosome partitioning protein
METVLLNCKLIDIPKMDPLDRTKSEEFARTLADSIRTEGMYNAIGVRPNPKVPGRYLIVHGKHRFVAVKKYLKEQVIECKVMTDMDDEEADMAASTENLWRNALSPAQVAHALQKWHAFYLKKNPALVVTEKAPDS